VGGIVLDRFRLLKRSRDHGGITAIVLGPMGTGKTTFLLSKLVIPLLRRREEVLIWRGGAFCQWGYLEPSRVRLLLVEECRYRFIDRRTGETHKPLDLPHSLGVYEVLYIGYPSHVLEHAKPGFLNVVYCSDLFFIEMLEELNERPDIRWVSVFHDEVQKLAPSNVEDHMWKRNKRLADALADTRKNYVSFYCTAHDLSDVDYRVARKMMYRVYLRDARIPRDSIIKNKMLSYKLRLGEAIVEGGRFKLTRFQPLQKQLDLVVKIRPWTISALPSEKSEELEDGSDAEMMDLSLLEGAWDDRL